VGLYIQPPFPGCFSARGRVGMARGCPQRACTKIPCMGDRMNVEREINVLIWRVNQRHHTLVEKKALLWPG